jgi:hypothetical protein
MAKLFSMDLAKDRKLIGNDYTWKDAEKEWKIRLKDITMDGYYSFSVRSTTCEWEEYLTREPNSGEIT